VKVEQAIYGESRGGHGLRLSSSDLPIISALTSYLDLPDAAPPGVDWSPFVSGFPHGKYYVLARTFADPAATRPGMVFSHAVIVPLDEIINLPDLSPLFEMLLTEPVLPEVLEVLEFPASVKSQQTIPELVSLADALVTRGRGPVVRFGLQKFDELIASLWAYLWPEMRSKFSFRLSFGPQDIIDEITPSVICTPSSLASRWSSYRVVGKVIQSSSLAAGILYGEAEAAPVVKLAEQVGAQILHFSDLPLLQRIYEIDESLNPQFDECVSALRILEKLSPNPEQGLARKSVFMNRLVLRLPEASIENILLLRNLGMVGLPDASKIWDALKNWIVTNSLAASEDTGMLSILTDALVTPAAVEPWRLSIINGLISGSQESPDVLANAFWRWAKLCSKVLTELARYLPIDDAFENQITKSAPKILDVNTGNFVMALAESKNWLKIHGAAASACLEPFDAIVRQLSVDFKATELEGLRAALRKATSMEVIELALAKPDEARLLQIAAERIAKNPALLQTLDFTSRSVQDIWCHALSINPQAWKGPQDPCSAFALVIQSLIDGYEASTKLIDTLSSTPLADLSKFSRRADVWTFLSAHARVNCLRATANGWLRCALEGDIDAPDSALEMAILAAGNLENTLCSHHTDIGKFLSIIKILPNIEEPYMLHLLNEHILTQPLRSGDAQELGRIILSRRWHQIVENLIRLTHQERHDLKPVLIECNTMVGRFWRFILKLSSNSKDDRWAVLEELVVGLYPNGPNDLGLWDRSGGEDADLMVYGSGRTRWHEALYYLQRGRGPHVRRLFEEIHNDYPQNEQVRILQASWYF